jgi:hypothetical protein
VPCDAVIDHRRAWVSLHLGSFFVRTKSDGMVLAHSYRSRSQADVNPIGDRNDDRFWRI